MIALLTYNKLYVSMSTGPGTLKDDKSLKLPTKSISEGVGLHIPTSLTSTNLIVPLYSKVQICPWQYKLLATIIY